MIQMKCLNFGSGSVSYSDDINSENYVGQFLDISNNYQANYFSEDLLAENREISKKDIQTQSTQFLREAAVEDIQQTEKLKSNFHNFQKHLVTTLRHSIDLSEVKFDQDTKGLQLILWDFFLSCPKMTRTLIYLVFGGMSLQNGRAKRFNKQYGLQKIMKSYPQSTIRRAQKNLREQALRQSEKLNFDWQLGNRRMKNKQQFRVYFEAFIEELKDGGFNKRIPKEKKIRVEKQKTKKEQDFQGLSFNKA